MSIAGGGKYRAYYCANAKEKGASVCSGMPGIHEDVASQTLLSTFQDELMRPEAYALFREEVAQQPSKGQDTAKDRLKQHDLRISELEAAPS